ncbi:LOW QUALITY PROTEIN: hypothetical protein PoB_001824400 [Plakobranchus ocellatus]|uniref:Uncharacterized protein n=1 Tax=Plakobranchus ocellatus TaxID=259542 RepID=A0AAV3Z8T8_9GAST|nr:LOW QUALITY PROTEIN: hypothetical protein PoB_001824400 [Plakobranchus ocellatus]
MISGFKGLHQAKAKRKKKERGAEKRMPKESRVAGGKRGRGQREKNCQFTTKYLKLDVAQVRLAGAELDIEIFAVKGRDHYQLPRENSPPPPPPQAFGPSVRPGRRWRGSNPRQKGPCRSQSGLASHCAIDAPSSVVGSKTVLDGGPGRNMSEVTTLNNDCSFTVLKKNCLPRFGLQVHRGGSWPGVVTNNTAMLAVQTRIFHIGFTMASR